MSRKFVVINAFTDLEDNKHVYKGGHFYPRDGAELDETRADVLASDSNAQKVPLIVEVLVKKDVETAKEEPVVKNEPKKPTKK